MRFSIPIFQAILAAAPILPGYLGRTSIIVSCERRDILFICCRLVPCYRNSVKKKQETEENILKLCGHIYHHGTYTPSESIAYLWGVRLMIPFPGRD